MRYHHSDQQRVDNAKHRMWRQATMQNSQPDKQQQWVIDNGKEYLLFERTNKLIDDETVSGSATTLDDAGRPFSTGVRDFIKCNGCGCRLNMGAQELYMCKYCRRVFCSRHSIYFQRKNITFCRQPKCYFLARSSQLILGSIALAKFCLTHIFGMDFDTSQGDVPAIEVSPEELDQLRQQLLHDVHNQHDQRFDDERFRY